MTQNPVDAVEPVADAFSKFGAAGAAVLGVLLCVGIFAWLAIKLAGKWESVQEVYAARLKEIAKNCHDTHDRTREDYKASLELVVSAHERSIDGLQTVLTKVESSNARVETQLVRLVERMERA